MYVFLLFLYFILVLILIAVILIQEPRSSGLGIFGGGVENIIGVRSAPTFFTNLTVGLGVAFGLFALILSLLSGGGRVTSVVEREAGKGTIYKLLQEVQGGQQPAQKR
jgi:protein translocase, SecG subunit